MLRAVGFDLDGTLFDHRGSARAGVGAFFRALGVESTEDALESWFAAEDEHFGRWRRGRIGFQEQRRERLRSVLPRLGVEPPADEVGLDALFEQYLRAYRDSWRTFPGSLSLLRRLRARGYRLGLLTNGAEQQQLDKLRRTGLAEAFDAVCTSERIGAHKPDPEAFFVLASELGVAPSQCLYVGDDAVHDVEGAKAAGMRGLLIDRDAEDTDSVARLIMGESAGAHPRVPAVPPEGGAVRRILAVLRRGGDRQRRNEPGY